MKWINKILFIFRAHRLGSKVHLRATIKNPKNIKIGSKVKVLAMAAIDGSKNLGGVILGNGVTINPFAQIQGGGIEIGDGSEINNFSVINGVTGRIWIGENVLIGPHVVIVSSNHKFDDPRIPIKYQSNNGTDIIIEDDVWIGAGVTVLPGVVIGSGCVVGAGCVVTKSAPPGSVLIGAPARVIKFRPGFDVPDKHSEAKTEVMPLRFRR